MLGELCNLFEDSVIALTEEGGSRVTELQRRASELKKQVRDMEMLFNFLKKLMDANAEVQGMKMGRLTYIARTYIDR